MYRQWEQLQKKSPLDVQVGGCDERRACIVLLFVVTRLGMSSVCEAFEYLEPASSALCRWCCVAHPSEFCERNKHSKNIHLYVRRVYNPEDLLVNFLGNPCTVEKPDPERDEEKSCEEVPRNVSRNCQKKLLHEVIQTIWIFF